MPLLLLLLLWYHNLLAIGVGRGKQMFSKFQYLFCLSAQVVLYEKPGFEGICLETDCDVFSIGDDQRDEVADGTSPDSNKLKSVGSLKIIGGL